MGDEVPIPIRLNCPECHALHIDEGEQATTPHRTHACQTCGHLWAPAVVPTVGVRFLPGCRNELDLRPEDLISEGDLGFEKPPVPGAVRCWVVKVDDETIDLLDENDGHSHHYSPTSLLETERERNSKGLNKLVTTLKDISRDAQANRGYSFTERVLQKIEKALLGLYAPAVPEDPSRPHIIDGEFQSDKYPGCPRGKVPLSTKDKSAQDLLWRYAQRRRRVDAQFADDLEWALRKHGYGPKT